jgi:HD-like signal output (HDOD) protein
MTDALLNRRHVSIKDWIGRAMTLTTEFRTVNREAERLVASLGIPPCPAIVIDIVREMAREEPDYMRVADLIMSDGGLAAAILKTVNSPFYGLSSKATTVHEACIFLGLRNTGLLIASLLLKRLFPEGDCPGIQEYWRSVSAAAAMINALTAEVRGLDRAEVHTFALFRDCGRATLLLREHKHGISITDIEGGKYELEQRGEPGSFAINHGWVGCLLAQSWFLPETICEAILRHHEPRKLLPAAGNRPGPSARLVALGIVADKLIAMQNKSDMQEAWEQGRSLIEKTLDISDADLPKIADAIANAAERRAA